MLCFEKGVFNIIFRCVVDNNEKMYFHIKKKRLDIVC